MKRGIVWVFLLSLVGIGGVASVYGANFDSPNFSINGSLGDSIGGGQSSSSYRLTSVGGESLTGTTSSSNYKLGQGYVPRLEHSLQITAPGSAYAYWAFENAAPGAQAFDDAPVGPFQQTRAPGTYSSGSVSVVGKIGNAWSDSTGNESITIPDDTYYDSSSNTMALSMWVKASTLGTNRAIATKWDHATNPTNGEWALQTTSSAANELRFYVGSNGDSGNNYVDTTNASLTTAMTHIMVVYDGTAVNAQRVKIYINGSAVNTSVTGTIPTSLNGASANPITFGDFPGLNRHWRGMIDEAKLTDIIDPKAVKAEYDATNAGIRSSLSFDALTPGTPVSLTSFVGVWTDSPYTLSINQSANLTNGAVSIPAVSGTIAAPTAWIDGTTKGLGFSLAYATGFDTSPLWDSGNNFAALPNTATGLYVRGGYSGDDHHDLIGVVYKLDTLSSQQAGNYTNQVTYTGTMVP